MSKAQEVKPKKHRRCFGIVEKTNPTIYRSLKYCRTGFI